MYIYKYIHVLYIYIYIYEYMIYIYVYIIYNIYMIYIYIYINYLNKVFVLANHPLYWFVGQEYNTTYVN